MVKEYNPKDVRFRFNGEDLGDFVSSGKRAQPLPPHLREAAAALRAQAERDRPVDRLEMALRPIEGPSFQELEAALRKDPVLDVDMSRFQVRRMASSCYKRHRSPLEWVWEILVVLEVLDIRGTGEVLQVRLVKTYPSHFPQERLPQEARKVILEALTHELDECLHIDGERFTDPHPESRDKFQRVEDLADMLRSGLLDEPGKVKP